MLKHNEQITAETQKAIDAALELLTTSIASVEKLTHIQVENSRQILEDTSQALKDLTQVSDPKDIFNRMNQVATHALEKNLKAAREVYEVITEVQTKVSKVANQVTDFASKNINAAYFDSLDAAKTTPGK